MTHAQRHDAFLVDRVVPENVFTVIEHLDIAFAVGWAENNVRVVRTPLHVGRGIQIAELIKFFGNREVAFFFSGLQVECKRLVVGFARA